MSQLKKNDQILNLNMFLKNTSNVYGMFSLIFFDDNYQKQLSLGKKSEGQRLLFIVYPFLYFFELF